jgi:hypothetical protein
LNEDWSLFSLKLLMLADAPGGIQGYGNINAILDHFSQQMLRSGRMQIGPRSQLEKYSVLSYS